MLYVFFIDENKMIWKKGLIHYQQHTEQQYHTCCQ